LFLEKLYCERDYCERERDSKTKKQFYDKLTIFLISAIAKQIG